MKRMDREKIAEFSYDVHSALGSYDTPDYDNLKKLGMAATLAIHIRGLGEISYEILKQVSYHYFKIPSILLDSVVRILEELEFVSVMGNSRNIKSIIPKVPHFKSIYSIVGEYSDADDLNDCEMAMLSILSQIYDRPENKQKLINEISLDIKDIEKSMKVAEIGGLIRTHKARGKDIVVSPYYFSDNLSELADLTAKSGSKGMSNVLSKLKEHQGWPLSLIQTRKEIGGGWFK